MLADLRDRVAELHAMESRLKACLADVQACGLIAVAELEEASRTDLQLRPLANIDRPPNGFKPGHIPLEAVRDAVVTLKHFTTGELAAQLGCSTSRARRELERVMDKVAADGHLGSRQLWAYVPPDGPGEAFKAQQRLAPALHAVEDLAADRDLQVAQSKLGMIANKEIRAVVKEALADGWELVHSGGRHPLRLERPGRKPITLVSTPRDAGNACNHIRRLLRAS